MLPPEASAEDIARFREVSGLNDPLLVQYARFLGNAVRGDFGRSLRHDQPSLPLIMERMPATLELSLFGMALALVVAVPLGILSAWKRGSVIDLLGMAMALIGQSMPNFWLGIMLIYIFAVGLRWLPTGGRGDLQRLILPGVTVAAYLVPLISRLVRSAMLEVLSEDYIRTARGKGLSESTVLFRHAFRNVLIPVVTVVALRFGNLLGGAVIIETVFAWPGVGLLAVQAIYNRDYPLVQASVFILALIIVTINFFTDLVYGYLDPRIQSGERL
jgi:ABC-type dipeptide/oligopeptide/nickel transport system permease component